MIKFKNVLKIQNLIFKPFLSTQQEAFPYFVYTPLTMSVAIQQEFHASFALRSFVVHQEHNCH
jgi:hypothetical protein